MKEKRMADKEACDDENFLYKMLLAICIVHFTALTFENVFLPSESVSDNHLLRIIQSAEDASQYLSSLVKSLSKLMESERNQWQQWNFAIHSVLSAILNGLDMDDSLTVSGTSAKRRIEEEVYPICCYKKTQNDRDVAKELVSNISKLLDVKIQNLLDYYNSKVKQEVLSADSKHHQEVAPVGSAIINRHPEIVHALISQRNDIYLSISRMIHSGAPIRTTLHRFGQEFQLYLNLKFNSDQCDQGSIILCDFSSGDISFEAHSLAYCIFLALSSGRMVKLRPRWPFNFCPSTYLENFSAQLNVTGDVLKEATLLRKEGQVYVNADRSRLSVFSRPLSENLENIILSRLRLFHRRPEVWAVGQMINYIFSHFVNKTQLEEEEKMINFRDSIVGIYMEMSVNPGKSLEDHLVHVRRFFRDKDKDRPPVKRRVLLVSTDARVFMGTSRHGNAYNFVYRRHHERLSLSRLSDIYDLHLLSRCDLVVCNLTLTSCRTIYEIMQTVREDASKRLYPLGGTWKF